MVKCEQLLAFTSFWKDFIQTQSSDQKSRLFHPVCDTWCLNSEWCDDIRSACLSSAAKPGQEETLPHVAATLSWNNDVIPTSRSSAVSSVSLSPLLSFWGSLSIKTSLRGHRLSKGKLGQRRWQREIWRRLLLLGGDIRAFFEYASWIGGGTMRSFFLSEKWMYQTRGRVSSDTQMHVAGVLADTLGQKTFFFFFRAVTLHVSCCYGDVSQWSCRGQRLVGEGAREGKLGTL